MAKIKAVGCQACPLGECKEQNFIAPVQPDNPDLIVLFSVHDKLGNPNLDVSDMLKLVETKLQQAGKKAIFLASQQCQGEYSLKSLKACNQAYVHPIIEQNPGLPVLVLGEKAFHLALGYKAAMVGKNGMAGKVLNLDTHDYYFSYGSMEHSSHILVILGSILGTMPDIEWKFGMPDDDFWISDNITLDIEHEYNGQPYMGGRIDCIGISNNKSDRVYCILPSDLNALLSKLGRYTGIIIGHNISSDLVWLVKFGLKLHKNVKVWDTMLHRKIRPDAPERGFGLKYLLKQDYQLPGYEAKVHGFWHRGEIPALSDLAWYNAVDVIGTKHLMMDQRSDDRNADQFYLAQDYIIPMINLMSNGLYINPKKLDELASETSAKLDKLKLDIEKLVGVPVAFGAEDEEDASND